MPSIWMNSTLVNVSVPSADELTVTPAPVNRIRPEASENKVQKTCRAISDAGGRRRENEIGRTQLGRQDIVDRDAFSRFAKKQLQARSSAGLFNERLDLREFTNSECRQIDPILTLHEVVNDIGVKIACRINQCIQPITTCQRVIPGKSRDRITIGSANQRFARPRTVDDRHVVTPELSHAGTRSRLSKGN